ncbi:carotenoid oxygenase family protein [Trichodesmium erythraeum]|uniref:carotenoid oxygenase family protein n=1 Tax=Trichodesmium erythraeum TaxID=1206 RepID=UPI0012DEAE04|nr:carotenoid oxygenase family protein [Trichodesmium erythraeum GBRTRLIN201]
MLTVVFDSQYNRSEVWIFDASHLDDEPVCHLVLLGIIPISFHSIWNLCLYLLCI